MTSPDLWLERVGPAAILTLNRPDKRNAVTYEMWRRLPELIDQAEQAKGVRALIVTGAGDAFAAGADISEFEWVYAEAARAAAYSEAIAVALDRLAAAAPPSIAKIRGACVGAGCGLALACDFRFAARGARFGITPGKLGLVYTLADTRRLVDAVGVSAAKDILFTARLLDAEEALSLGLIDRLVEDDELDARVDDFVGALAAASGRSARVMKALMARIQGGQAADDDETRHWFFDAFQSADFAEGYRAFLDKRKPEFPGD